jgi:hypothetical protein
MLLSLVVCLWLGRSDYRAHGPNCLALAALASGEWASWTMLWTAVLEYRSLPRTSALRPWQTEQSHSMTWVVVVSGMCWSWAERDRSVRRSRANRRPR